MIQLPKRSVTRFFIPMIDVLILLFCIFLLLPFASQDARETGVANSKAVSGGEATLKNRLVQIDRERKRLSETRSATAKELSGRIAPVILKIDPGDGGLVRENPSGPVRIDPEANPGQVRRMVEEDRRRLAASGGDSREPYYIFLPSPSSPFPTVFQRQKYLRWFAEADAAADVGRPDMIFGGKEK